MLSFNPEDQYDLTPYLNFTDKELSITGSTNGYVVIGNSLKKPIMHIQHTMTIQWL